MVDHASTGAAHSGRRGHRPVCTDPMAILRTVLPLAALALALPVSAGAAERTVVTVDLRQRLDVALHLVDRASQTVLHVPHPLERPLFRR